MIGASRVGVCCVVENNRIFWEEIMRAERYPRSRSKLHPKAMEEQMTRHPKFVENNKKPLKPKADDQSHEPAKHIEEIARLASSVETAKDPSKVRRTKD